jgi:glyoxylase-like metal-dependent hydrolase (beta-lactamase superfamily II)
MTDTRFAVLDRRKFLTAATALVAAGLLPKRVLALAGPQKFTQGSVEVTIVSDGTLFIPLQWLAPDADPAALNALVTGATIKDNNIELVANVTLLKDGAETILLDMGSGKGFQPTSGQLLDSLAAAGVDPASITKVAYTHGHPDHFWGTTLDGKLQLPNASYHMAQAELDFWSRKDLESVVPKDFHFLIAPTQANLAAIKEKVTLFKPGDQLSANVAVIDTVGHTPGHVSFEVAGGDGLIVVGDAIVSSRVHFAHPEWRATPDAIPEKAIASRKMVLERAVAEKKKLLGYHWQTPVGYAEKKDGAYVLNAVT